MTNVFVSRLKTSCDVIISGTFLGDFRPKEITSCDGCFHLIYAYHCPTHQCEMNTQKYPFTFTSVVILIGTSFLVTSWLHVACSSHMRM